MKNLYKLAGIAVFVAAIGFILAACSNGTITSSEEAPSTSGRLTISNIPELYKDRFIGLSNTDLLGCANISDGKPVWSKIKNGEATLKIWKKDGSDYVDYNTTEIISCDVKIYLSSDAGATSVKTEPVTSITIVAGKGIVDGSSW